MEMNVFDNFVQKLQEDERKAAELNEWLFSVQKEESDPLHMPVHAKERCVEADRRLQAKIVECQDLLNEYTLLRDQTFQILKTTVDYRDFYFPEFIIKAGQWWMMKHNGRDSNGNKLDLRKKYEEKEFYQQFIDRLNEVLALTDNPITEFTNVEFYNLPFSEVRFRFDFHGHDYGLRFPIPKNMEKRIFILFGISAFQFNLVEFSPETPFVHKSLVNSFDLEDIKTYLHSDMNSDK